MRNPLAVALIVAIGGVALLGQSSPPPRQDQAQPPPTFKVEVNYVEIDAVVTDAKGKFVTDLTEGRFPAHRERHAAVDHRVLAR